MLQWFCLALLGIASVSSAALLYDASLGTSPAAQGLTYQQLPTSGGPYYTAGPDSTTFNTTAGSLIYAGFHSWQPDLLAPLDSALVLDRTQGFWISLEDLIVHSESHTTFTDRAGFSWIVLADDHVGIELSFWSNGIWAQSATFTHAEETSITSPWFNPSTEHDYDLWVQGSIYALFADESPTPLLTGELRDYSVAMPAIYSRENFIFLGDNSSSAQSHVTFGSLAVVPEPASLLTMTLLGTALLTRRRARTIQTQ